MTAVLVIALSAVSLSISGWVIWTLRQQDRELDAMEAELRAEIDSYLAEMDRWENRIL